jgi:N-acetylmuramoyl-L-alanine amidase
MLKKIIAILKLGISCVLVFFLASCSTPHVTTPPVATSVYEVPAPSDFARGGAYHSIAPGETLWRISKMYDVNVDTLKKVNRIRNVRKLEIGQKLYIPGAAPRKDVVTLYPSRKWKYIIIHHSATDAGNSMQFNKTHLRRGWKGVGYHFIIDNGTMGKDDGQIETGPRMARIARQAR